MGDFLNQVVSFLEEYYVYVIGVGLIIILMLIGFLSSKKKDKNKVDKNETMVNINEVNTGSISDVASTLQGVNVMQPIDVVTFNNESAPVTEVAPEADDEVLEVLDTAPIATPVEPIAMPVEPIAPTVLESNSFTNEAVVNEVPTVPAEETKPVENAAFVAEPIVSEAPSFISPSAVVPEPVFANEVPEVEEAKVDAEQEKEDEVKNQEIIDFSSLKSSEPISEIKPANYEPFVVDKSQYSNSDDILNGENSSNQ
jgi:hypothetical protein